MSIKHITPTKAEETEFFVLAAVDIGNGDHAHRALLRFTCPANQNVGRSVTPPFLSAAQKFEGELQYCQEHGGWWVSYSLLNRMNPSYRTTRPALQRAFLAMAFGANVLDRLES